MDGILDRDAISLMVELNSSYGWSDGDDIRVLVASGIGVSLYSINEIRRSMNEIGGGYEVAVGYIQDLLDEYESAQAKMIAMNSAGEGKTLVKADVLEWEVSKAGVGYSPELEFERIRRQMYLYFANSSLFGEYDYSTSLVRS